MNPGKSLLALLTTIVVNLHAEGCFGQDQTTPQPPANDDTYKTQVEPLLQKFCVRCHNAENAKSGVRVDQLKAVPDDRELFLWAAIRKQVDDAVMPPAEEPQMTEMDRKTLDEWIANAITAARIRDTKKNGSVRRLTVSQYRNTLKALLKLEEDLTDSLPPDGISKDGFSNQSHTMVLSPLQVEAYFDIAEKALDLCIVDESKKPVIQNFRMDLGTGINPQPCPDNLILGANSFLLKNPDVLVTELQPQKPFAFEPFLMRTEYDFIEGYVGNDTIRAWKKFDSIYHSVFACMRGSPGYPKGEAFQVIPAGLLLRPAIPSPEIFGQSDTYGPMANFKISLRELPDQGNFRVTVKAARYADALLLDPGSSVPSSDQALTMTSDDLKTPNPSLTVLKPGIYQLDVYMKSGTGNGLVSLTIDDLQTATKITEVKPTQANPGDDSKPVDHPTPLLLVRLTAGEHRVWAQYGDNSKLSRLVLSPVSDESEQGEKSVIFEKRHPSLAVYLGLRRDCGSTLTQVQSPTAVLSDELQSYVFEGAINDFPSPDVEKDNVNYLAGIREIGVRSEYTDGRDMPRMLIRSVEFEGPFYESSSLTSVPSSVQKHHR